MHAPMGFIHHRRPLYESHTFFITRHRDIEEGMMPSVGRTGGVFLICCITRSVTALQLWPVEICF
jgi:hypothetical protein